MIKSESDAKSSVSIPAGTKIIGENEISQKMFIIIKGKARVYKSYLGQRITLAVLSDGEIFGEMSFVDAQPRSASVEALTEMEVMVIDGASGSEQLKNLPSWVWTIFRTVFHRFRELDREIVALQSAVSYRKKGMKVDIVASTIYLELVRFIKTFLLVSHEQVQRGAPLKSTHLLEEVDALLGNRAIGLKPFWRLIQDYDFIESTLLTKKDEVQLIEPRFSGFDAFLKSEIKAERYLTLSHGSLSILRSIVGYLKETDPAKRNESQSLSCQELQVYLIPNHEKAIVELEKHQIIPFKDQVFQVTFDNVHELYIYHSIVKNFDCSSIYVD